MATAHLIGAEEYLHSTFEYDAEYVDGRIVQRPMPSQTHSEMQGFLVGSFFVMREKLGIRMWPEQRIRTQPDPPRYRIPDVCVTYGKPAEEVYSTPPHLCIEILSPDDSAVELRIKVDEYLDFGVSYVWVIDPVARTGEIHTSSGIEKIRDGKFKAGEIEIDLADLQQ
jgi:Uma2 family endonuclease